MKITVAPGSFKGSLSAEQAAGAMVRGIAGIAPETDTVSMPLADGGEGTVSALVAAT
ncbi:glycerate kinase, partial [candidate division KSB1 bacterium]|nr:glycerate kinase [candidate division KSB1 bacterium]